MWGKVTLAFLRVDRNALNQQGGADMAQQSSSFSKPEGTENFAGDEFGHSQQSLLKKVSPFLTREEQVMFATTQKILRPTFTRRSIVLTNRRVIVFRKGLIRFGIETEFIWRDLKEVKHKDGLLRATVTLTFLAREREGEEARKEELRECRFLPKAAAKRACALAQEMEEKALEERRVREIEEKRAESGGVTMHSSAAYPQPHPPVAAEDPAAKLGKLKNMMEAGLISQEEFEKKKAEVLSEM